MTGETDNARRLAVVCAAVMAMALVALVALRRPSAAPVQWSIADGPGFSIALPATPTLHVVDGGTAGADTAVVRDRAYTVVWFAVAPGAPATSVLSQALAALAEVPARLLTSRPVIVGPFAGTDLTARVASDYLHGRLVVVGARAYLIAELTPTLNPPADLTELLTGFDPDTV